MTQRLIQVELIPSTSFGNNLRSHFKPREWDLLRRHCYRENDYLCQICHGRGRKHPVEAHELWRYEGTTQTIWDLLCLCPACHMAHHPGFMRTQGREEEAILQTMKVNQWTRAQVAEHYEHAKQVWIERSKIRWTLNLTPARKLLDYLERA